VFHELALLSSSRCCTVVSNQVSMRFGSVSRRQQFAG